MMIEISKNDLHEVVLVGKGSSIQWLNMSWVDARIKNKRVDRFYFHNDEIY